MFQMFVFLFSCAVIENVYHKMSEGAKHLPTGVESEITGFDSTKLKHAECHEKTSLPTADGTDLFLRLYFMHNYKNMSFSVPFHNEHRQLQLRMFHDFFLTCYRQYCKSLQTFRLVKF